MEFQKINLDNIGYLTSFLRNQNYRQCDFTIGALYVWSDYYQFEYLIHNNTLYLRATIDGKIRYFIPLGNNLKDDISFLQEFAKKNNQELEFCFVPEAVLAEFTNMGYHIEAELDFFDYLYNIKDLIELSGNKYKRQRNHINKFLRLYKNYQYQELTVDDIPKVLQFLERFNLDTPHKDCSKVFIYDLSKTYDLVKNFDKLGQIGGLLLVDGEIVALTIGEIIKDTIYIHTEKALRSYHGSYMMINNLFLKNNQNNQLQYVNREEDVGDEGLRQAKQSYRPIKLLNKFFVKIKL